jgi:hypothetical protein
LISEKLAKPGTADLLEIVQQAREEHKERVRLRILAREQAVQYRRRVSYDPLSTYEVLGLPVRKEATGLIGTATDKQLAVLNNFGLTQTETLSRPRASQLLDELFRRRKQGLASVKQVSWLIREGVEPDAARAMTMQQASAYLDSIWGKRREAN